MVKKILCSLLFILPCLLLKAQKSGDVFYIFRSDWSPAPSLDSATYFMKIYPENDTTYYCRYYQKYGPMVKQECYKDSGITIPNGQFLWFNKEGKLDSTGDVRNGKRAGWWNTYNDTNLVAKTFYQDGKRTFINLKTKKQYNADGTVVDYVEDTSSSTGGSHIAVKASYPGGPSKWVKYLQHNLQVPERFQNIIKNGVCPVTVVFLVIKTGDVAEEYIAKSCEWSADDEAIRVIKKGGKWIPATIDGNPVIFRQRQQISFSVSSQ